MVGPAEHRRVGGGQFDPPEISRTMHRSGLRFSTRRSFILLLSYGAKKFDLDLTLDLAGHWEGGKVGVARETAMFRVVVCLSDL